MGVKVVRPLYFILFYLFVVVFLQVPRDKTRRPCLLVCLSPFRRDKNGLLSRRNGNVIPSNARQRGGLNTTAHPLPLCFAFEQRRCPPHPPSSERKTGLFLTTTTHSLTLLLVFEHGGWFFCLPPSSVA